MGKNGLPSVSAEEIREITDFIHIVSENPRNVIITPQLHAHHITRLFLVIETIKKEMLDVACQTNDFKSFDRLCLFMEGLGL